MPNQWIQALKTFNEGKKWSIPSKGTDNYNMVKNIMNGTSTSSEPKKTRKVSTNEEKLAKAIKQCKRVQILKEKIAQS